MSGDVRHAFSGLCQLTQQSVLLKRPVNISPDRTNHWVLASNLVPTAMIHRPAASHNPVLACFDGQYPQSLPITRRIHTPTRKPFRALDETRQKQRPGTISTVGLTIEFDHVSDPHLVVRCLQRGRSRRDAPAPSSSLTGSDAWSANRSKPQTFMLKFGGTPKCGTPKI
jgi:hypothetical protein